MGDQTAFFYGTLMAREVLNRVIYGVSTPLPSSPQHTLSLSLTITLALLPAYCRHKVQHADYPGIIPDASREVRGTYVTGLTEGDIWRLDRFEGSEYDRRDVVVTLLSEDEDGKGVEAEGKAPERKTQTYVYTAGEERLEKEEWDYEVFRREKMHRWADASDEYRDVDEAINDQTKAGHDPTGGRGVFSQGGKEKEEEKLRSAV
ncbi:disease resistance protein Aig2 [Diplocarpon rosae]|nr:disease resistance protein Aig2 [Diplocarpon rosae]